MNSAQENTVSEAQQASTSAHDVKRQKWWGWGEEGFSYDMSGKPKFAAFVKDAIDVDITLPAPTVPPLSTYKVPGSQLSDDMRLRLEGILGADNVLTDDESRVIHAYGKGVRDLVRVRRGNFGRVPDVVVYPGSEADVIALVDAVVDADGVLIPYGGGSNIVAALEAEPNEQRLVVSVNMGRMNKVLEIDEQSGLARVQAGALGPDLEEQLNRTGWTLGHFPDSFNWSTIGGWIATRSSGAQSDKYGDISDITRGMRVVLNGRVIALRPLPSSSSGPSVREMLIGSEGRLGIITEAWINVHRLAPVREIQAYFYPDYDSGLKAAQEIVEGGAHPMLVRVSDAAETQFTMANGKAGSRVSQLLNKAVEQVMVRKGWNLNHICLSFIGYEGDANRVRHEKAVVGAIVRRNGGMGVGKGPGTLYDQKKYDIPFIRDFLLDRGIPADVSETSTPWSKVKEVHDETVKRAEEAFAATGHKGFIMCHLSHSYHSGACQYFTFAIADDSGDNLKSYDAVKQAVQQSFMDHGGTVSHHHGVGEEHSPWMAQDISEGGVFLQRTLFDGVDPGRHFNPGKIVHDGRPGISTNSEA